MPKNIGKRLTNKLPCTIDVLIRAILQGSNKITNKSKEQ